MPYLSGNTHVSPETEKNPLSFKTMLRKASVRVISITEPNDDTAVGKFMEALIEGIDEFYSANLGD